MGECDATNVATDGFERHVFCTFQQEHSAFLNMRRDTVPQKLRKHTQKHGFPFAAGTRCVCVCLGIVSTCDEVSMCCTYCSRARSLWEGSGVRASVGSCLVPVVGHILALRVEWVSGLESVGAGALE